ncbi:MAG: TetR/AcrR family transcriptional regulator [Parasphingopyxis sp.]|uniref:TetR/AcrR family transcriptional regulator n=1 Tax=Parasphingopyxis sp. TaxID=1920299 RepID=UPI003F9F6328
MIESPYRVYGTDLPFTRKLVNTPCMEKKGRKTLGRDHWIIAAYEAFEQGGVDAVKVDRLAKTLGVTRGGFYWHFKNIADLMQMVLHRWRDRQTESVITRNEDAGGDPREKLRRLLIACAEDDGRFEVGIRLWMADNADAKSVVAEVDERRTAYIAALLQQIGLQKAEATRLAPVAYSSWLGEYSAAVSRTRDERIRNMEVLYDLLVGEKQTGATNR